MLYDALKTIHLLSIILWVGGMMFAHWFLRPALGGLEAQSRLRFMRDVLTRFFKAVFYVSLLVLITGYWMMGRVAKQTVQAGLSFEMPIGWWVMAVFGTLMVAIFMHIRFALFKRFRDAVELEAWDAGAKSLASIRTWVSVNLGLGILIVIVTLLAS
jgi:uncharacterized membrane protein